MSVENITADDLDQIIRDMDGWWPETRDRILVLIRDHDAKVRAETLREARDNVRASSFWADGSDNYADRVRGYLSRAADRIEKEAGL